jgi:hypothetical protein
VPQAANHSLTSERVKKSSQSSLPAVIITSQT